MGFASNRIQHLQQGQQSNAFSADSLGAQPCNQNLPRRTSNGKPASEQTAGHREQKKTIVYRHKLAAPTSSPNPSSKQSLALTQHVRGNGSGRGVGGGVRGRRGTLDPEEERPGLRPSDGPELNVAAAIRLWLANPTRGGKGVLEGPGVLTSANNNNPPPPTTALGSWGRSCLSGPKPETSRFSHPGSP